ncbi:MAG: DNA starvation/stationary phase protection protein [Alphaproteobacteria bacterium]|jgi:starvation-inducible DNA-binding protein|nr:DNA starvation/stationary phase protection protein [Alphaproteobacteria bacterium]
MAKKVTKNKSGKGSLNAQAVMAKQLALILSNTYVLAVKTHGYHWNVMGPSFGALHALFEAQYNALILSADAIAERIRALGMMPDGSMDSFLQNTVIKEAGTKPLSANAMLKDLHASYEQLRERLVATEDLADDMDDLVTQDMITQQLSANDKTMWMLRAHAE